MINKRKRKTNQDSSAKQLVVKNTSAVSSIKIQRLKNKNNIQHDLMKVNLMPVNGILNGLINVLEVSKGNGGSEIPFGLAYLNIKHVDMIKKCINVISKLDMKIKKGFEQLFTTDFEMAGKLIRKSLNLSEGENTFIERLIEVLKENPAFCNESTSLFRADGLYADEQIIINELNANPIGGMWLTELSKNIADEYDKLGIDEIPNYLVKQILAHTPKGEAYFLPVRNISGSSSYAEKLMLSKAIENADIKFFIGELNCLIIKEDGVYVEWMGELIKIGFMGGLSSPEVFEGHAYLFDFIISNKLYCPSIFNSILGLCNKGTFTIITEMREGKLDASLLGLSKEDLNFENCPLPNTYWLIDSDGVDRHDILLANKMVAKPITGVGGKGVFLPNQTREVFALANAKKKEYLIQAYFPSFPTDELASSTSSSLDPYYIFENNEAKLVGVLVRSASHGMLPNLTINSKNELDQHSDRHVFALGLYHRQPEIVMSEEDLSAIYHLRVNAWVDRINTKDIFPNGYWMDEYDKEAIHWAIKNEGTPVASARLSCSVDITNLPYGDKFAKYVAGFEKPFFMLSRLVVAPSFRRRGYSTLLDVARLRAIRENSRGTAFVVTSNKNRIATFLDLGFQQISEIDAVETFPGGKSTLFAINHSEIKL